MFAGDAHAQSRVEGTVRTTSGAPHAGATVQISGGDLGKPVVVTADEQGRFVFTNVKPGIRVKVQAIAEGRAIASAWTLVTSKVETVDLTEETVAVLPDSATYLIVADGPAGEIAGYVRGPGGSPVNALVTINESAVGASTDQAGRYVIDQLRSGLLVDVRVAAPGFEPAKQKIEVPDGGRAQLDFSLTPAGPSQGASEAIGPAAFIPPPSEDGTIAVRPEQIAAIPAANRNDLVRAVQFLPGVAGTIDAAMPLLVRGGTADQTRATIDGITLYQLADGSAGPVAFNTDSARTALLARSPFGALDGGQLGGALRMTGTSADRPSGFVDVSGLGAAARVQVPVGRWLSAALAVRSAAASELYTETLERFAPRIGEPVRSRTPQYSGGPLADAPSEPWYRDVHARFDLQPSSRDRIAVSLYDGENDSDLSYDLALPAPGTGQVGVPDDPPRPTDAVLQAGRVRSWTGSGWSGVWRHAWSPTASSTVTLARSEYSNAASQAWVAKGSQTGQDYSHLRSRGGSSGLTESNDVTETTFRAESTISPAFAHAVSFGAEVSNYEIGYAARAEAATTNGNAGTSTLADLLRRSDRGRTISAFVHDSWRASSRLTIAPGARIVRYDLADATYVEPRITASYQARPDVRLTAGWSIDHQVVNRVVREDRAHGDGGFWALAGGANMPVPRAQQAVAGVHVSRPQVTFDLTGFVKRFDDLTLFAPRLYPGVVPAADAKLLHTGTGTAFGVEAIVQHRTPRNALLLAYTIGRSEQTFPTLEHDTFPASYDRLQEIKAMNAFTIASRWTVSGAFVVGSGLPYTSTSGVETVWFPTGAVVSQVKFGDKNGLRLAPYHRLDLSSEKGFAVGRIVVSIGGTVFNVYDQKSPIARDYINFAGALTTQDVLQMGRAFITFLRVGF